MENFSQEQLLGYIKKQKARIKQLETENESLTNQNKNLTIENTQCKQRDILVTNNELNRDTAIEKQPATIISSSATVSTNSNGNVNKILLNNCLNMILNRANKEQHHYTLQLSFFKWKSSFLLQKLDVSQKNIEISKEATAQSEVKINKLKALLARTHHSKQVCAIINNIFTPEFRRQC